MQVVARVQYLAKHLSGFRPVVDALAVKMSSTTLEGGDRTVAQLASECTGEGLGFPGLDVTSQLIAIPARMRECISLPSEQYSAHVPLAENGSLLQWAASGRATLRPDTTDQWACHARSVVTASMLQGSLLVPRPQSLFNDIQPCGDAASRAVGGGSTSSIALQGPLSRLYTGANPAPLPSPGGVAQSAMTLNQWVEDLLVRVQLAESAEVNVHEFAFDTLRQSSQEFHFQMDPTASVAPSRDAGGAASVAGGGGSGPLLSSFMPTVARNPGRDSFAPAPTSARDMRTIESVMNKMLMKVEKMVAAQEKKEEADLARTVKDVLDNMVKAVEKEAKDEKTIAQLLESMVARVESGNLGAAGGAAQKREKAPQGPPRQGVSLLMLIQAGLLRPGKNALTTNYKARTLSVCVCVCVWLAHAARLCCVFLIVRVLQDVPFVGDLTEQGNIVWEGKTFTSPSGWSIECKRTVNPGAWVPFLRPCVHVCGEVLPVVLLQAVRPMMVGSASTTTASCCMTSSAGCHQRTAWKTGSLLRPVAPPRPRAASRSA